jgi:outer membrane immunogenic protein
VRKSLLASAALFLFPLAAHAADKVAEAPPTGFTWQGPYIGAHAGFGWGTEHDDQSRFFPTGPGPGDRYNLDGFIGGVHAGYNWQLGSLVYGLEADLDASNIKGGTNFDYGGYSGRLSFRNDIQGSARLRVGYALDRTLIYGTGGVAFAHGELTERPDGGGGIYRDDRTHVGWTIGSGVEYAFTDNWIGRLEGRYTSFGNRGYNMSDPGFSNYIYKVKFDQAVVNVGLSYKF